MFDSYCTSYFEIVLFKKQTINKIKSNVSNFHLHSVLGKSTIGDIIKEKEKWLAVPADSEDSTRSRNAQHQQLDDALYLWFSDMSAHHALINDEMLLTKARQLGQQIGVTDFSYSRGYLHRFKSRRGIKRKLYEGEADSADILQCNPDGKTYSVFCETTTQRISTNWTKQDSSTDLDQTTPWLQRK